MIRMTVAGTSGDEKSRNMISGQGPYNWDHKEPKISS